MLQHRHHPQKSEREICKALVGHYKALEVETRAGSELVEEKIKDHLHKDSSEVPQNFVSFQNKLESVENMLRNSLEEKRVQKLARLTPRPFRTQHTHMRHLQLDRRGSTKGYAPYRTPDGIPSRKGKGPTSGNFTSHTWKMTTPSSRFPLLGSPTSSFRTPPGRRQRDNSPSHGDELKRTLKCLVS